MRTIAIAMILLVGSVSAGDKPHPHPHFDDGGTLRWFTKFADAQSVAKKEGKLILIEYGRQL
jgi:hypothetical protein